MFTTTLTTPKNGRTRTIVDPMVELNELAAASGVVTESSTDNAGVTPNESENNVIESQGESQGEGESQGQEQGQGEAVVVLDAVRPNCKDGYEIWTMNNIIQDLHDHLELSMIESHLDKVALFAFGRAERYLLSIYHTVGREISTAKNDGDRTRASQMIGLQNVIRRLIEDGLAAGSLTFAYAFLRGVNMAVARREMDALAWDNYKAMNANVRATGAEQGLLSPEQILFYHRQDHENGVYREQLQASRARSNNDASQQAPSQRWA